MNGPIMPTIGISDKYTLPISNIDDLKKLNSILEEKMERNIFMRNMVQVGGKNDQVSTYRIMEKILTAQLSMEMNWSGKNPNKYAIMKLKNLVLCIVQSVCMTNKGTEHDVETNIKNYLRTAKDRLRLREKQKPKMVAARSIDQNVYQRQDEIDYEELRREITTQNMDNQMEAIPLANE